MLSISLISIIGTHLPVIVGCLAIGIGLSMHRKAKGLTSGSEEKQPKRAKTLRWLGSFQILMGLFSLLLSIPEAYTPSYLKLIPPDIEISESTLFCASSISFSLAYLYAIKRPKEPYSFGGYEVLGPGAVETLYAKEVGILFILGFGLLFAGTWKFFANL